MNTDNRVEENKEYVNLSGYSMDFPIGSEHWFNTLMAKVLHIGEYMKLHPDKNNDLWAAWGESLYNIAKDMFEWQKQQPAQGLQDNPLVELIEDYHRKVYSLLDLQQALPQTEENVETHRRYAIKIGCYRTFITELTKATELLSTHQQPVSDEEIEALAEKEYLKLFNGLPTGREKYAYKIGYKAALQSLPAPVEGEGDWISVDNPPAIGKFVSVLFDDNETILQGRLMLNGWAACFIDGEILVGNQRKIIGWQPLPTPPKK